MQEEIPAGETSAALFVGTKAPYYLSQWARIEQRTHRISWNWAAFSLGPIWLVYRKMYWETFLFVAGFMLICGLAGLVGIASFVSQSLSYSSSAAFGVLGNLVYKMHVERAVRTIEMGSVSRAELVASLRRKGGVSRIAAALAAALSLALVFASLSLPESYLAWLPL